MQVKRHPSLAYHRCMSLRELMEINSSANQNVEGIRGFRETALDHVALPIFYQTPQQYIGCLDFRVLPPETLLPFAIIYIYIIKKWRGSLLPTPYSPFHNQGYLHVQSSPNKLNKNADLIILLFLQQKGVLYILTILLVDACTRDTQPNFPCLTPGNLRLVIPSAHNSSLNISSFTMTSKHIVLVSAFKCNQLMLYFYFYFVFMMPFFSPLNTILSSF